MAQFMAQFSMSNFFMFIINNKYNHTIFLVQFGLNKHLQILIVFENNLLVLIYSKFPCKLCQRHAHTKNEVRVVNPFTLSES